MLREYDVIRLKKDIPEAQLKAGAVGAVLIVYPDDPPAYEVEFLGKEGETLALLTLEQSDIEKTTARSRGDQESPQELPHEDGEYPPVHEGAEGEALS